MSFPDEKNKFESEGLAKSSKRKKRTCQNTKSHYFLNVKSGGDYDKAKSRKLNPVTPTLNVKCGLKLHDIFFEQPCITLAKSLLGKVLVRQLPSAQLLKGIIVETESYLGFIDKASHSFNGKRTERNEAMYLQPGTSYVYTIYGMYYCFNISSLEEGSAVLIRALEPLEGCSKMMEYRSKIKKISEIKIKDLCNGPSKLCQAFKIDKDLNKVYLCLSNDLWLEEGVNVDFCNIISCKRIGIDSYGEEWGNKPLRFYIKNNCFVSRRDKIAEAAHAEILTEK